MQLLTEVSIVENSKTSVADVQKLIESEECELAKLRARREAFAAQEQEAFAELVRRREALAAELDEMASELAELRGEAAPVEEIAAERRKPPKRAPAPKRAKKAAKRRRGRPKGRRQGLALRDAVRKILADGGKPMRAPQVASQLDAVGYKTASSDPVNMVSALLAQTKKEFRRVRRGLYTIAKSGKQKAG